MQLPISESTIVLCIAIFSGSNNSLYVRVRAGARIFEYWKPGQKLLHVPRDDILHCRSRMQMVHPDIPTPLLPLLRPKSVHLRVTEHVLERPPRGEKKDRRVRMSVMEAPSTGAEGRIPARVFAYRIEVVFTTFTD